MHSKSNDNMDTMSSEQKILYAATELIAEKGYDATSVDEIAKTAQVTKPTIYYYFKGKQEILEEIIKRYLTKISKEKELFADSIDNITKENLYERLDQRMSLFRENKQVLKIIAMEVLKENPASEIVLRLLNAMFVAGLSKVKEMGIEIDNEKDLAISNFFFATMPTLMLTLFGERFCELYEMDNNELHERFFEILKLTYVDYSIAILNK